MSSTTSMYTKAPPREDVGHRQQETETEKEASPVIEEHNGYPATYTCDAPEGGYTKTLQFQFDYEFVIKDPMESLVEIWYQDLPALEWGILARVVQVIGLESCSFDEQQGIREWRPVGADGSANMIGNSMFEESRIISLSRSRADELDMTVESCEHLVDFDEDNICLPMRGKMTALYTGDDTQAVENYLLHHIQTEIDSQRVLVRQIKEIIFLGDRTTYGLEELGPLSSDGSVGLPVGLSLSACFLTVALIVYAATTRKRKRKSRDVRRAQAKKKSEVDIPKGDTGSMHSSESEIIFASSAQDRDAEVPSTTNIVDVYAAVDVNTSVDDQLAMDMIMDDLSDCPSDAPALHPQDLKALRTTVVDLLPPLAPGQLAKPRSKTMKKRRKMKKKKRIKLTRVNSRENMNEMETISEANEEVVSDDDDDDVSEYYSTDDDDSSADRTSRDPSPARSRTGSMGSAASGASGGVPPSPIKEEPTAPKIRLLPPPWRK